MHYSNNKTTVNKHRVIQYYFYPGPQQFRVHSLNPVITLNIRKLSGQQISLKHLLEYCAQARI